MVELIKCWEVLGLQIKEFLNQMCEQIKYKPIRAEISEEMENHLLEAKENYILGGMQEAEAEQEAIRQMGNAEEIGKKLNKIHHPKLDWKLLLNTIVLMCFGVLILWINGKATDRMDGIFFKYGYTLFLGILASVCVYFMDYRKLLKTSKYFYGLATLLMILTLKFGLTINGVKSWLSIGGISIAAPVFAVPLYMLAFIGFLQNLKEKRIKIGFSDKEMNINRDIFKMIGLSVISLGLLMLVPTTTSAVVLGLTYLIIATVKLLKYEKSRKKYIAILWGFSAILGMISMVFVLPSLWSRVMTSFAPQQDPAGGGWIGMNQSIILGNANLFGEADNMSEAITMFDEGTNFAFISILAHYGWIVSLGMVVAIVTFSVKLLMNAAKIKDMYGKLVIVGVSSLFILQSVFNLLMNLNLGMKSDFNIPFISYGNSNLVMNMVCLALVLSVYRRKDVLPIKKIEKEKCI